MLLTKILILYYLESSSQSPGPVSPLLGSLQLDLYQKKDVTIFLPSTNQPGSSPHDKSNPLGRLHLRLKYDLDKSDLHVHVIEGKIFRSPNFNITFLCISEFKVFCYTKTH